MSAYHRAVASGRPRTSTKRLFNALVNYLIDSLINQLTCARIPNVTLHTTGTTRSAFAPPVLWEHHTEQASTGECHATIMFSQTPWVMRTQRASEKSCPPRSIRLKHVSQALHAALICTNWVIDDVHNNMTTRLEQRDTLDAMSVALLLPNEMMGCNTTGIIQWACLLALPIQKSIRLDSAAPVCLCTRWNAWFTWTTSSRPGEQKVNN